MNAETSAPPVSLGLRLLALLYDVLPLLGLWFLAGVVGVALTGGALDPHRLNYKILMQALVLAFTAGYFVLSWTRGGQTIGMRAWKLRLTMRDGSRVLLTAALLRFFLACLSLILLGAGYWWSLFDPQRRTLHDALSDTRMTKFG
ncbi:MAG TPA: RDD family protein [Rudaea sp.]|jgi:uncharacterized RDD family membrane protein YckC|nr:RDD family protein [Rudaea sp.]